MSRTYWRESMDEQTKAFLLVVGVIIFLAAAYWIVLIIEGRVKRGKKRGKHTRVRSRD